MCTRLRPATDRMQHVTDDQLSQRTMAQYALRASMYREERPAWISANVAGLARGQDGIRWPIGIPVGLAKRAVSTTATWRFQQYLTCLHPHAASRSWILVQGQEYWPLQLPRPAPATWVSMRARDCLP